MNYIDLTTNEVVSKQQLIKKNKDKSIPKVWNANVHSALNVAPIIPVSQPDPSSSYKIVTRSTPRFVDGEWRETWSEQDMFSDTADRTKAEQEAEYQDKLDSQAARENREKRDTLLSRTDWWATSDRTMTQAQTDYRQALRDITTHANFPNLVDADWPTKP